MSQSNKSLYERPIREILGTSKKRGGANSPPHGNEEVTSMQDQPNAGVMVDVLAKGATIGIPAGITGVQITRLNDDGTYATIVIRPQDVPDLIVGLNRARKRLMADAGRIGEEVADRGHRVPTPEHLKSPHYIAEPGHVEIPSGDDDV